MIYRGKRLIAHYIWYFELALGGAAAAPPTVPTVQNWREIQDTRGPVLYTVGNLCSGCSASVTIMSMLELCSIMRIYGYNRGHY